MEHEVKEEDKVTVIAFSGDVDLQNSQEARNILLAAVDRSLPVLVDMSRVDYIDSSGIASLVEGLQCARKRGCELVLVSVSEPALKVLQLARLDQVFSLYGSLEEAAGKTG